MLKGQAETAMTTFRSDDARAKLWTSTGAESFPPKRVQAVARRNAIGREERRGGGAQGRRFSREQCQMVHLSRWVRSPSTPAPRSSDNRSLASRQTKVDGRQRATRAPFHPKTQSLPYHTSIYYRWSSFYFYENNVTFDITLCFVNICIVSRSMTNVLNYCGPIWLVIFFLNSFFAYVNVERMKTYAVCIEMSRSRVVKKEEQYQVLRPDELPSSADIHGSVGSSSVCIAYTYTLRRRRRTLENSTTQHLYNGSEENYASCEQLQRASRDFCCNSVIFNDHLG